MKNDRDNTIGGRSLRDAASRARAFGETVKAPRQSAPATTSRTLGGDSLRNAAQSDTKTVKASEKASTSPTTPASASGLPASAKFGKFVRVQKLGQGGMGEVWKAWDTELNRWVALKFLLGGNDEEIARFKREAQTAGALDHPNIAGVYEVGYAQSRHYIAMQFIEGQTLKTFPRSNKKLLVRLVRDAAVAVQCAHENGIVHRDIKPENVMVVSRVKPATSRAEKSKPVESHRVYVMDFGLARQAEGASDLSVTGLVVGTPAYMSPEQARGEKVDVRADVYSLGASLYELLTDRKPFQGKNVLETLKQVQEDDPRPPHAIDHHIDTDLETIVLKCLEKDKKRRYASADALADDLSRWLAGDTISARSPSLAYRARKFASRRKAIIIPSAVAVVLGIALLAWLASGNAERARKVEAALGSAAKLERAGNLVDARAAFESALAIDKNSKEAQVGVQRTLEKLREAETKRKSTLDKAMALLERGRPAIDKAFQSLYRKDDAYAALQEQLRQGQSLIEEAVGVASNLSIGHYLLGRCWELQGDLAKAEASWRKAIEADARFGPAHYQLGRLLMVKGFMNTVAVRFGGHTFHHLRKSEELEEARQQIESATVIGSGFDDALQRDVAEAWLAYNRRDTDVLRLLSSKGLEKHKGKEGSEDFALLAGLSADDTPDRLAQYNAAIAIRPKFALALYCRACEHIKSENWAQEDQDLSAALRIAPSLWPAWSARGNVRERLHAWDAALSDFDAAAKLAPREYQAYIHVGKAMAYAGKADEQSTLAEYQVALDLDPKSVLALVQRALYYASHNNVAGALRDLDTAIAIQDDVADLWFNRGAIKRDNGDMPGAMNDLNRAIELQPTYTRAYASRAIAWAMCRNLENAIKDMSEASRLDPNDAVYHLGLGSLKLESGDIDGARDELDKCLRISPTNSDALHRRGLTKVLKGAFNDALVDIGKAIEVDPKNADLWEVRGSIFGSLGDYDAAIRDYTQALKLRPESYTALRNRGVAYAHKGAKKEAIADHQRALALAPRDWNLREDTEQLLAHLKE